MYLFLFFFNSSVLASEMQDRVIEASYQQSGLKGNVELLMRYGKSRVEILGLSRELGVVGYCVRSYRGNFIEVNINGTTIIEIRRNYGQIRISF